MKIIDAIWEKRNLNVDTVEFEIEENDDISVIDTITGSEKQYNVVKIPSQNYKVIQAIQECGYRFVEIMAYYIIRSGALRLTSVQQRIVDSIETLPMSTEDIEELHFELNRNIFDTDRVYCDKHFTHEQAANRYWGWINDEINRGGKLFKYVYKGKNIGFSGVSRNNSTVFLSGMYSESKHGGFGLIIPVNVYRVGMNNGDIKMYGMVSSTNISVQKMYTQMGYTLDHTITIMVKNNM